MGKVITKVLLDYLVPIFLGGLIGGLLVGAFFVWPTVYGAKWWEVFTAFGTVGAVVAAIWVSLWSQKEQAREQKAQSLRSNLMASRGLESLCFSLSGLKLNEGGCSDFIERCYKEVVFYKNKISHPYLLQSAMELERILRSLSSMSAQKALGECPEEGVRRLNRVFSECTMSFLREAISERVNVYSY